MTDLTTWALEKLDADLNRTGLAVDQITLYNRDDSVNYDTGTRRKEIKLTEATVVSVALLDRDSEIAGAGDSHRRAEAGVSVRIKGAHTDQHGHVPDADAFEALVDDVERVLLKYRNQPPSPYHALFAPDRFRNLSNYADEYRTDVEARVRGYEDLPDAA